MLDESATNPRRTFEPTKLVELAHSLTMHGLIQPITVRPKGDRFEVVAGARRFRAAQIAELADVPTRILELSDEESYFAALRAYLHEHGCPVAFYSDKHSVFRVVRQDTKGGQGMTQFGRALSELNIEILCANSSQAKGRVERANRTLQDRLVKELRLAGISSMAAGNAFLPAFMERYNERFSVPPARTQDIHRPLRTTTPRLNDILCHREQRYVGAQLTFHYDRKQIILEQTDVAKGLEGQYVELFDYYDKPLEVRWRSHVLPYRVFSKDQRVSHTAIVENKRLGHALAIVKAQQDLRLATKVMTNSEKTGYKKRVRLRDGLVCDPSPDHSSCVSGAHTHTEA